ncbi:hypothetical protein CPX_001677 [Candidatus Phytoplasma pruni]|uniref:Uncharacterized protein n=1 Tax=Candidatus Phytoplasma pruni TaxID=479893 RepID=A0A0M1N090_9MOLU|nr:hypothetical protein CPX_001677 [Candidatus Phytoplasma pruni]
MTEEQEKRLYSPEYTLNQLKHKSNGANNIYIFKAEKLDIKNIELEPVDDDYNKFVIVPII